MASVDGIVILWDKNCKQKMGWKQREIESMHEKNIERKYITELCSRGCYGVTPYELESNVGVFPCFLIPVCIEMFITGTVCVYTVELFKRYGEHRF